MLSLSLQNPGNTKKIVSFGKQYRMGTRELTHEALLMERQEKIMACRGSGGAATLNGERTRGVSWDRSGNAESDYWSVERY